MMTTIMFIATLVLGLAAVVFSAVYLFVSASDSITEAADRRRSALTVVKAAMIASSVSAFLTSLLADSKDVAQAISASALLYSILAVAWLAVLLGCGVVLLMAILSKRRFDATLGRSVRGLLKYAVIGAGVCLLLSWLLA